MKKAKPVFEVLRGERPLNEIDRIYIILPIWNSVTAGSVRGWTVMKTSILTIKLFTAICVK
jgi:hypothetical protein